MLELLAIVLLAIWVLGIAVLAIVVPLALKDPEFEPELSEQLLMAIEQQPVISIGLFTILIAFWPVTLPMGALMEGKN